MFRISQRAIAAVAMVALVFVFGAAAGPAHAADERCFPETGQCLGGRFRPYCEQNGGLAVFGFPLAAARDEANRDTGKTYLTQWYERNRFELHPETPAPYDVLLGRLGDDRLRQLGRNWQAEGREGGAQAGCRFFAETGHNVCDQGPGLGFKTYWEGHGLQAHGALRRLHHARGRNWRDAAGDARGKRRATMGWPLMTCAWPCPRIKQFRIASKAPRLGSSDKRIFREEYILCVLTHAPYSGVRSSNKRD